MDIDLSAECKKDLLRYARETIGTSLGLNESPSFSSEWSILADNLGLFVTLTIDRALRGCIGYIETQDPISKTLKELANSAAFRDPRFPALAEKEFPDINVEMTLLSLPQKIKNIDEIKIGTHGLIISRGYHRGLLLPQVATEHNLDLNAFLKMTCRKAGLHDEAWEEEETIIEIFEGYIFSEKETE